MISSSGGISYSIQNFFPKTFFKTNFISRLYPDKKYFKNESLAKNFLIQFQSLIVKSLTRMEI